MFPIFVDLSALLPKILPGMLVASAFVCLCINQDGPLASVESWSVGYSAIFSFGTLRYSGSNKMTSFGRKSVKTH